MASEKKISQENPKFVKEINQDQMQDVFRLLFSGDNSLTEMFDRDVILTLNDIEDLNTKIIEKLSRNRISGISFQAIIRFENGKLKEYNSWNNFITSDWNISNVLDTMQLNWTFLIADSKNPHNYLHTLSVFCSSSIKPQHLIQALLSSDPSKLEKVEIQAVPISCKINYTDHVISQELMSLVSEWNKGLGKPEYVLKFMTWFKKKSTSIVNWIERSIPILMGLACFAAYSNLTAHYPHEAPACAGLINTAMYWLLGTAAVLFLSIKLSSDLADYVRTQIVRYGTTTVFSITNGDLNRQNELMAKSTRIFYKFIASSIFAILWNVIGGIITAIMIKT